MIRILIGHKFWYSNRAEIAHVKFLNKYLIDDF